MLPALSGFFAGVAHVASGPDHLAAVAPLAIGKRRSLSAALVGASWGLGHGLGVAAVGAAGQLLKGAFGLGAVTSWAEVLVGIFLIGLGAWTIHKSYSVVIHEHTHAHDGDEHTHLHVHPAKSAGEPAGATAEDPAHAHRRHHHRHAALGIGVVHGLAGSGHLYAVLPSLAMGRPQAAMYLAGYLLAAVAAMAAFGAAVGWISRVAGTRHVPLAMRVAGWVCVVVGVAWIVASASASAAAAAPLP